MTNTPIQNEATERETIYFETYEINTNDLETLQNGIETVAVSQLLDEDVLDNIRFVTYDSSNLYVITRGEHQSTDRYTVEQLPSLSQTGFKIFRIPHSGFIGKSEGDYRGAVAWLLCDEIETTAVNAKKFPNEYALYEPTVPQPSEILDVVSIAPLEPYNKIQQGRFNYLTDVIFHEAGHIEHRRLINWQGGKEPSKLFPSDDQRDRFLALLKKTKIFSEQILISIIDNVRESAIHEMYAMLIDREAARRYDEKRYGAQNTEIQNTLLSIRSSPEGSDEIERFINSLKSAHTEGTILVRILEEQFPDYTERKAFMRSVLDPSKK